MKKVIAAAVVVAAVGAIVALTMRGSRGAAARNEWPLGLGTLDAVPARYPRQPANDAAIELQRLAARNDAAALRAHLLSGTPLLWETDIHRGATMPTPDYRSIMRVHKTLPANSWEDLRARWALARPLWQRPEMISSMLALTITRDLATRAAELPGPEPAWFAEVRTFDYRRAMIASMQADAWVMARMMRDYSPSDSSTMRDQALAPYFFFARSDFLAHQRKTAVALVNGQTPPEVAWWNEPAKMGAPSTTGAWKRLLDLEAALRR